MGTTKLPNGFIPRKYKHPDFISQPDFFLVNMFDILFLFPCLVSLQQQKINVTTTFDLIVKLDTKHIKKCIPGINP